MKAELTLKLGNKLLKITGEGNETGIMKNLSFWSQLPEVCHNCGGSSIGLQSKTAKTQDGKVVKYYGLKCICGAELTFHQKQEDGSFYITPNDAFSVYQKAIENKTNIVKPLPQVTVQNDEDLPF
jgi:hypothetical protein